MNITDIYLIIHPKEGGDDAKNFAFIMKESFIKYMSKNNISFNILEERYSDRELLISFCCIINSHADMIKSQQGYYKLIRKSPYDKNHNRHTSFCSIYVIEISNNQINFAESDILKEFISSSKRAGGQHLNHGNSAVRLTHIPTGIKIVSQSQRDQHSNYQLGLKLLREKVYFANQPKQFLDTLHLMRTLFFDPQRYCKNHLNDKKENVDQILNGQL